MISWMLGTHGDIPPTQVAHLQGRTELMEEENFALLISLLAPKAPGPLWSLNLGEIPFSVPQMIRIREALAMPNSTITHLFMEPLPHAYPLQAPNSEAGR